eukprot:2690109-Rhodomonas_salina.1
MSCIVRHAILVALGNRRQLSERNRPLQTGCRLVCVGRGDGLGNGLRPQVVSNFLLSMLLLGGKPPNRYPKRSRDCRGVH